MNQPDIKNGLRPSDADRNAVSDQLNAAFAEGRISLEEHGLRIFAVHAAQTIPALKNLTTDLPDPVIKHKHLHTARVQQYRRARLAKMEQKAPYMTWRRWQLAEVGVVFLAFIALMFIIPVTIYLNKTVPFPLRYLVCTGSVLFGLALVVTTGICVCWLYDIQQIMRGKVHVRGGK